jgi:hypothetical protein
MKAKLLKTAKGHYVLVDETKETHDKDFLIATSRESDVSKLSIQNCDQLFGVVDVEELAKEFSDTIWGNDDLNISKVSYIEGFNKAIELNKNNLFTEGQMWEMFIFGESFKRKIKLQNIENKPMGEIFNDKIKSLRQPAEIDVEIEMEYIGECNGNNGDGCFQDSPAHNCGCFQRVSKLDSNGCLILKKI